MNEILKYLEKHGECIDAVIAEAMGIPLATVHIHLAELKAKRQIMTCDSTRFVTGKEFNTVICRISGYVPPAKPGAKPKQKAQ